MAKSLLLFSYRYSIILCFCLFNAKLASAQTDADALMITKNFYCAGGTYANSGWTNYWEGTFKRDNLNLGKVSTNTYTFIGNYGITSKLNLLFNAPYVTTHASEGTLKGQSGFQDLSVTLKWLAFQHNLRAGKLSFFSILTGAIPLSNYEPDFQPMSIGLHSKSVMLRGLLNYKYNRFLFGASAQYIQRANITIDRNAYYTNTIIYSNQVYMPNANNMMLSAGYLDKHIYAAANITKATTLGGFDIRKNDMPFPSNTMNATTAGAMFKYSFSATSGWELLAGGNYVLAGRNVGQSQTLYGGLFYLFNLSKNTK